MTKKTYDSYYYWENIRANKTLDNPYPKEIITTKSKFFHGVIINCNGQSFDRWLHLPEFDALLGFINYVFMPSSFHLFLTKEKDFMTVDVLNDLLDLMENSDKVNDKVNIPLMRGHSTKLNEIWNCSQQQFEHLKSFCVDYNKQWNSQNDLFSYIDVYQTPLELGKQIVEVYEKSDMVNVKDLENQIEVSVEEWLDICSNVYENEFMRRKFTDILNNKIIDML